MQYFCLHPSQQESPIPLLNISFAFSVFSFFYVLSKKFVGAQFHIRHLKRWIIIVKVTKYSTITDISTYITCYFIHCWFWAVRFYHLNMIEFNSQPLGYLSKHKLRNGHFFGFYSMTKSTMLVTRLLSCDLHHSDRHATLRSWQF